MISGSGSSLLHHISLHDGRSAHVAHMGMVIIFSAAMHGGQIIPHHHIAVAPFVGVGELQLRGVIGQLVEQSLSFIFGPADNVRRM